MKIILPLALLLLVNSCCATPRFVVQSGHNVEVNEVRISPNGKQLASLSDDSLRIWGRDGFLQWSAPLSGSPFALAWSRDSQKLAVGYGGKSNFILSQPGEAAGVLEYSSADGIQLHQLPFGNNVVTHLRYTPHGTLEAISDDGLALWDVGYQRTTKQGVTDADYSPDGQWRAQFTGELQVIAVGSGKIVAKSAQFKNGLPALGWSPDSRRLLAFDGRNLWVWDQNHNYSIPVYRESKSLEFLPDAAVAITPDGHSAVCTRTDYPDPRKIEGQVDEKGAPRGFLWRIDLRNGKVQNLRTAVPRFYGALAFWPDGTLVIGGAHEAGPEIYNSELSFARLDHTTLHGLWGEPQPLGEPYQMALSPDGKTLAVGGGDTAVRLWDLKSGRLSKSLKEESSSIVALDFSPDGKRLGAIDYTNFFLFDVATGRGHKFPGIDVYEGNSNSVSFAPDGKRVAFGSGGETEILDIGSGKAAIKNANWYAPLKWTRVGLWQSGPQLLDTRTLKPLLELNGAGVGSERPGNALAAFDFAPQAGKLLTIAADSGSEEPLLQRWDIAKNKVERTLSEFHSATCVAVSPDEKQFVAGNTSGELAVFDFDSLHLLWKAETAAKVNDVKWSRDQNAVFAACSDGFTRVFSSDGTLQATLCALPSRLASNTGYQWLRFSPDGTFAASAQAMKQIRVFDGDKPMPFAQLPPRKRENLELWHGPNHPLADFVNLPLPHPTPMLHVVSVAQPHGAYPKLILQGDKIYQFSSIAVSRGEKWVASSQGERGEIQLCDGRNALQWDTWPAASGDTPLMFTPDATRLLTRAYRNELDNDTDLDEEVSLLAVCAVPSGHRLHTIDLPTAPLWCDNSRVRGVKDGTILDFDLSSGHKIASHKIENAPKVQSQYGPRYDFSRNGRFLIEGSSGTIRWWRVSDGKCLGFITDSLRAIGKTAISDDGKWLASEGDDPDWSPPTDSATESAYARNFRLHVWSATTKKPARTLTGYFSLDGGARLLEFSADGQTLFGANNNGLDRYNWRTGKNSPLPPPQKDFRRTMSWPLTISSDGQLLAGAGLIYQSSDYGPGLQLWNVGTSKPLASFAGTLRGASKLKWSPDGKYLAGSDRLTLWDAHTGALIAENPRAYDYRFDWIDNQTIRSQTLGQLEWYSVPKLEKLREFDVSPKNAENDSAIEVYSDGISVSPDGTLALTEDPTRFGGSRQLWAWEVVTNKLERKISIAQSDWGHTEFDRIVWLPDNSRVVFGTPTGMTLLNVRTGTVEKQWNDPTDANFRGDFSDVILSPLAVSSDGKWLVVRAARDNTALVYDLQTEDFVRRLPIRSGYHAQFLKDAHTLVVATEKGLEWWDVATISKAPQHVLSHIPDSEWTLSPDEKQVAFGSNSVSSNGVSIWSTTEDKEKVRLYLMGGTIETTSLDWIALTPEGFYDASARGETRLRWRDEKGFWPIEKSRAAFRNPGKVAAALQSH